MDHYAAMEAVLRLLPYFPVTSVSKSNRRLTYDMPRYHIGDCMLDGNSIGSGNPTDLTVFTEIRIYKPIGGAGIWIRSWRHFFRWPGDKVRNDGASGW